MFVGELAQFSFVPDGATTSVSLSLDGKVLLQQTYYRGKSGEVTLFDLDELLDGSLSGACGQLTIKIDGSTAVSATVFKCGMTLETVAAVFIPHFWLTPYSGTRVTSPHQHEILSCYAESPTTAMALCRYLKDGEISSATVEIGTTSGLTEFTVSPGRFRNSALGRLIDYQVICGARVARYRVDYTLPELSDAFIFINAFGVWETLYMYGARETTPEYERTSANVSGFMRNYQIKERVSYKTKTGPLPWGSEPVAMGLAASPAVFLLKQNGDAGQEIIINDCDLKHDNIDFSQSDLSMTYQTAAVSYRLCSDRGARLFVPKPNRIYDYTFDETYE